jgi:hypothetical protein
MEVSGQSPSTLWIGNWMGPRESLGVIMKQKTLAPAGNHTSAVQPTASHFTD